MFRSETGPFNEKFTAGFPSDFPFAKVDDRVHAPVLLSIQYEGRRRLVGAVTFVGLQERNVEDWM
jgi:hypothetical protein